MTAEELRDVAAGNLRPGELDRAKENLEGRLLLSLESTSNRMTRLGKALVTDSELVSPEETLRRVRRGHRGRRGDGRARALRAGAALRGGHRAAREPVPRRARAHQPGARRAVVKVCLFGAAGKVGGVLGPALERAGHEVVDGRADGPGGCDVAVDFTRPDAVLANAARCLEAASRRVGTTGFDADELDRLAREAGVPCLYAPNFALGAVLMMRFAEEAARRLPAREIVELHAETKLDAPSGPRRRRPRGWRGDVDPLGAASRPRGAPGGAPRRAGGDADDPPRHDLARGLRPRRAARDRGGARAAPGLTVGLEPLLA